MSELLKWLSVNWPDLLAGIFGLTGFITGVISLVQTSRMNKIAKRRYLHEQLENDVTWEVSVNPVITPEDADKLAKTYKMASYEDIKGLNAEVWRKGQNVTDQTRIVVTVPNFVTIIYPKEWNTGIYSSECVAKITWTYTRSGLEAHYVPDDCL